MGQSSMQVSRRTWPVLDPEKQTAVEVRPDIYRNEPPLSLPLDARRPDVTEL